VINNSVHYFCCDYSCPSVESVKALQQRHNSTLSTPTAKYSNNSTGTTTAAATSRIVVVIDACQLRSGFASVKLLALELGAAVLITGSKRVHTITLCTTLYCISYMYADIVLLVHLLHACVSNVSHSDSKIIAFCWTASSMRHTTAVLASCTITVQTPF
jgi:hypothetical protein